MNTKEYVENEEAASIGINWLARQINVWANLKGFWDKPECIHDAIKDNPQAAFWLDKAIRAQKMALVTTETSEQVEALRLPEKASEHIPDFTGEEEEVADQIIRLLDYCGQYNLRIGEAIIAKMAFNEQRPHRHGKAF